MMRRFQPTVPYFNQARGVWIESPRKRLLNLPDGALRVTVCGEGSLGMTVSEHEGRAAVRHAGGAFSAAFVASGGRLRRGMALLAVDGTPTPDLESATEQLSGAARPVALDFEVEEVGEREGKNAGRRARPAERGGAANRAGGGDDHNDVRVLDVSAA